MAISVWGALYVLRGLSSVSGVGGSSPCEWSLVSSTCQGEGKDMPLELVKQQAAALT